MKYGVFGDIHSNLEAWEVVCEALSKEKVDKYICLGDIVGYGADPSKCIERVRKLDPVVVCGNHDWAAVGKTDINYFNPYAKEAVLWTGENLNDEDKGYLRSLELVHDADGFTLVHGTLDGPEEFKYILDLGSARGSIELMKQPILFVAHSHTPLILTIKGERIENVLAPLVNLSPDQKYLINVGSVGQPRDGDPRACYVIYDQDAGTVEIKRIDYDIATTQQKINEAGLPSILSERLVVGR